MVADVEVGEEDVDKVDVGVVDVGVVEVVSVPGSGKSWAYVLIEKRRSTRTKGFIRWSWKRRSNSTTKPILSLMVTSFTHQLGITHNS